MHLLDAGWSSLVARQAHNLKVAGSNPAPATQFSSLNFSRPHSTESQRPFLKVAPRHGGAAPATPNRFHDWFCLNQTTTCRLQLSGQNIRRSISEPKIQRSSVVERSAVNRLVVGSNPTAGANFKLLTVSSFFHLLRHGAPPNPYASTKPTPVVAPTPLTIAV